SSALAACTLVICAFPAIDSTRSRLFTGASFPSGTLTFYQRQGTSVNGPHATPRDFRDSVPRTYPSGCTFPEGLRLQQVRFQVAQRILHFAGVAPCVHVERSGMQIHENAHQLGIAPTPRSLLLHQFQSFGGGQSLLVRPWIRECIVYVGDLQNARQ